MLLPKEHGAYGQLTFPLVTALAVFGVSSTAALIAVAIVCAFLAHEPLLVLIGARGPRARRAHVSRAAAWLSLLSAIGVAAAASAFVRMAVSTRWSILVPIIPAISVAYAIATGREKTSLAEVGVGLTFAFSAFPVAIAAGASIPTAATVTIVFAVTFSLATLAVRVVILRVRGEVVRARHGVSGTWCSR